MKKALFIVSFLTILLALGVAHDLAKAAETTIAVTVEFEEIAVSVMPTTWMLGPIGINYVSGWETFTGSNDGNVELNFTISVGDGTEWTCDLAGPGIDKFGMEVSVDGGTNSDPVCVDPVEYPVNPIPVDGDGPFQLQFSGPTENNLITAGESETFAVTLYADRS